MGDSAYGFIFAILIFYGVLGTFLFALGVSSDFNSSRDVPAVPTSPITIDAPVLSAGLHTWLELLAFGIFYLVYILIMLVNLVLMMFLYVAYFFVMVGYSVSGLPFWFGAIIFIPLGLTLAWVILTLIRGGGG